MKGCRYIVVVLAAILANGCYVPLGGTSAEDIPPGSSAVWTFDNEMVHPDVYYTRNILPKGTVLHIEVAEAGNAPIVIVRYYPPEHPLQPRLATDMGGRTVLKETTNKLTVGAELSYELPDAMHVGMMAGAGGICSGCWDDHGFQRLTYNVPNNRGHFVLKVRIGGEPPIKPVEPIFDPPPQTYRWWMKAYRRGKTSGIVEKEEVYDSRADTVTLAHPWLAKGFLDSAIVAWSNELKNQGIEVRVEGGIEPEQTGEGKMP
jgi:hypothetical protein